MVGAGTMGSGIAQAVAQSGYEVAMVDVKQDILDNIPPVLGAAALALTDYDLIDFLPPEIKEDRAGKRFNKLAVAFLITLAIGLTGFWASLKYKNDIESFRLKSAQDQIERFTKSDSFRIYNRIKQQMASDKDFLTQLDHKPTFLHLNLKELSRITPEQIKLDIYDLKSSVNKPLLSLSGIATSFDQPPEVILAEFVARLENSPFYDNVKINRYSKRLQDGKSVLEFYMEMEAVI